MAIDSNDLSQSSNQQPTPQDGVRKLAAIMFTDIKDFSKKMQKNEAATMRMLDIHNRMMRESVERHHGNVIKTVGDAFLVSFESVVGATQCAIEAQQRFYEYNADKSSDEKITVRVGVHLGDVIIKDNDVFGDGVNIASRIQSMAEPGGVNISGSVYEQVKNKFDIHVINLGVPQLKNIKDMIKVYQVIIVPSDKARGKVSTQIFVAKTILKRKRSQRIAVAVAISIAVMAIVWRYVLAPPPPPSDNSIAVLPFVNMSDSSNEYYADGLSQDIISNLTRISQLRVTSEVSSFYYKNSKLSLPEIASNLGVKHFLTGTINVLPTNIRINVRLVDPNIEKDIWTQRYDGTRDELPLIQNKIAREIAQRLRLQITVSERVDTISPEVSDLYYRGLFQKRSNKREDNNISISYFRQALEKDPNFIPAKVHLAKAELLNYEQKWDLAEKWLTDAENLAHEILKVDSLSDDAYEILGNVQILRGDHKQGTELFEKSLRIDPNNVATLAGLGVEYAFNRNDPGKAVIYFERAREIEPTYFPHLNNLGVGYALMRNYTGAVKAFRQAVILNPTHEDPWRNLGYTYERMGEFDNAITCYRTGLQINVSNPLLYENIGILLLSLKRFNDADSLLLNGLRYDPGNYRLLYALGLSKHLQKNMAESQKHWKLGLSLVEDANTRDSTISQVHVYKALFAARLGNSKEAIEEARHAVELDSTDNENLIAMARTYAVLGERDSVVHWFARAKSLNPEYDAAYLATAFDFEKYRDDPKLLAIARQ